MQYSCDCALQSATSLDDLHGDNCLVGMSTVTMMDAESANHHEDVNSGPGEKNPSSCAHQMKIILLWFWLAWLSPRRPGRCWTMGQLEIKCSGGWTHCNLPILGSDPADTGALSFPFTGQIVCKHSCHVQVGGLWLGCGKEAWSWWSSPLQHGLMAKGQHREKAADEGKLSPAPQALVTPGWVHREGFSLEVCVPFQHPFSSPYCSPG